jgi:ribosome biogenesis ATPase
MSTSLVLRGVRIGNTEDAVDLEQLVQERCEGYSGADLAALIKEAGVRAVR